MAISGITNLLESIANQQFGLDPANSNGANPVQPIVNNDPQANNQDTFTPRTRMLQTRTLPKLPACSS